MRLHEITQTHSTKAGKRVGRGISAGQGKTAGRGTKGQKARTGANSNIPRTFDGGASNFVQRLPKLKGFKSRQVKPLTVSLSRIAEKFEDKASVTLLLLIEKGLVDDIALETGVKIVGSRTPSTHSFVFDLTDTRLKLSQPLQPK